MNREELYNKLTEKEKIMLNDIKNKLLIIQKYENKSKLNYQ